MMEEPRAKVRTYALLNAMLKRLFVEDPEF